MIDDLKSKNRYFLGLIKREIYVYTFLKIIIVFLEEKQIRQFD